jgi:hypothetical protein
LLSYLQKQDTEAKTALVESAKLRKCLGWFFSLFI